MKVKVIGKPEWKTNLSVQRKSCSNHCDVNSYLQHLHTRAIVVWLELFWWSPPWGGKSYKCWFSPSKAELVKVYTDIMVWLQQSSCCLYFRKKEIQVQSTKGKETNKQTLCSCLNVLVGLTGLWWHTGQGWHFQTPPSCPSPPRGDRLVGHPLRSPACSLGRNAERVETVSGGNNLRQITATTTTKKTFYSSRLSGMLCSVNCHSFASIIKYSTDPKHKEMSHKMQMNKY